MAAAGAIARQLDSQMVIGPFLALLPLSGPVDADVSGALATAELLDLRARPLIKPRRRWPSGSGSFTGQSRFGALIYWPTTSSVLQPARPVSPNGQRRFLVLVVRVPLPGKACGREQAEQL
jgi:hypothetical protein